MANKKLLLVEDDLEIAKRLQITTKELNSFSVIDVSFNLNEGIKKLSSTKYDILILDLNLPDGNGIELLKWIKENQLKVRVYVFSLSIELKKMCLKLGAHSFYDKSKDFDLLMNTISDTNFTAVN